MIEIYKNPLHRLATKICALITAVVMTACMIPAIVSAVSEKNEVGGKLYVFGKKSSYEFTESDTFEKTDKDNTYGTFSIGGDIEKVSEKSGVPSYEIGDGNLSFYYNYSDDILKADIDSWHLVNDKSKKISDIKLKSNIMKGAIVLQTSKDRINWVTAETICNAFGDTPVRTDPIYSTTDIQLINGCYYRVIVAYELSIRTKKSSFLGIRTDKYDNRKYAEVYEFYAHIKTDDGRVSDDQTYSIGSKVRVQNFAGYFGEKAIDKKDVHYGWDLGNFFVRGYTDKVYDADGDVVFLKNVGDRVTLWFNLSQNIDRLNGNKKLSITADTAGYDQYFETPKMNFGRGVLIIRYTDHNNVRSEPTIYTNYLEANAMVGADTKVQLFEEGDYEVALDYQITSDEFIDKTSHYRIFFRFSVRNGNCMVYPFDIKTGSELTNSSMTENGFRLDLAKSRYLKINLKREVLKDSADGLVEDTRFNGPAKDGAKYTDEGIYIITVSNTHTGQFTVKKIYVGTNKILKAYITTGLTIQEINNLIANGATISDDGTIRLATAEVTGRHTVTEKGSDSPEEPSESREITDAESINTEDKKESDAAGMVAAIVLAYAAIVACIFVIIKKKSKPEKDEESSDSDDEEGTEQ